MKLRIPIVLARYCSRLPRGGCRVASARVTLQRKSCRMKKLKKKGSSPISGEGGADLEEEVVVVAEAVGHAFDDFDFVVDALQQTGVQRPAAVRQDAGQ